MKIGSVDKLRKKSVNFEKKRMRYFLEERKKLRLKFEYYRLNRAWLRLRVVFERSVLRISFC